MNLNQGKRNKQAVQVLNKVEYDSEGNPIGMIEDPSNPASANFGTPREPRRGGCYEFSGTENVNIGVIPWLNPIGDEFTISFWFYVEKLSSEIGTNGISLLISNRNQIANGAWEIQYRHQKLYFSLWGGVWGASQVENIPLLEWHHYTFTFSRIEGIRAAYVDGKRVFFAQETPGTSMLEYNQPIYIGRKIGNTYERLSDARLFGLILAAHYTDQNVANQLYMGFAPNKFTYLIKYNCSENSGNIAYDSPGNGHHGQIINAITTTPEENPNSIHQYQDVYSFENEEGYSEGKRQYMPAVDGSLITGQGASGWHQKDQTINSVSLYRDFVYSGNNYMGDFGFGVNRTLTNPRRKNSQTLIKFKIRYDNPNIGTLNIGPVRLCGPSCYNCGAPQALDGFSNTIPMGQPNIWHEYQGVLHDNGSRLNHQFYQPGFAARSTTDGSYQIDIKDIEVIQDYDVSTFPKNSSITLPPFKDVLGNNLQYQGNVPGKAKFVGSSCYQGSVDAGLNFPAITLPANVDWEVKFPYIALDSFEQTGHMLLTSSSANNRYMQFVGSSSMRFIFAGQGLVNMSLNAPSMKLGEFFSLSIKKIGAVLRIEIVNSAGSFSNETAIPNYLDTSFDSLFFRPTDFGLGKLSIRGKAMLPTIIVGEDTYMWPLCEPIIDPSNHIYHDVSGNGNHATLINGTLANKGKQDKFHYLQRGFFGYRLGSTNSEMWLNDAEGWNDRRNITHSISNGVLTVSRVSTGAPAQFIFNSNILGDCVGMPWKARFRAKGPIGLDLHVFVGHHNRSAVIDSEGFKVYETSGTVVTRPYGFIQVWNEGVFEIDWIRFYIDRGEKIPLEAAKENEDYYAITQDGHSFLNTGTELEAYDYPALRQADKDNNFWNEDDGLGTVTPKPVQFDNLITQKGLSDKLFLNSSVSETIKNVRMYGNDLKGRQLNTENKLTNN